jgi:hypothetical protein
MPGDTAGSENQKSLDSIARQLADVQTVLRQVVTHTKKLSADNVQLTQKVAKLSFELQQNSERDLKFMRSIRKEGIRHIALTLTVSGLLVAFMIKLIIQVDFTTLDLSQVNTNSLIEKLLPYIIAGVAAVGGGAYYNNRAEKPDDNL